jgi:hypothetical protein
MPKTHVTPLFRDFLNLASKIVDLSPMAVEMGDCKLQRADRIKRTGGRMAEHDIIDRFASVFFYVSSDNDHEFGLLLKVGSNDQMPGKFSRLIRYVLNYQRIRKTGFVFLEAPYDVIRQITDKTDNFNGLLVIVDDIEFFRGYPALNTLQ